MLDGGSEMDLFLNECSFHGQFPNVETFVDALDELMMVRQTAKRYKREIHCHRNSSQAAVTHNLSLPQAISLIDKNKARALMAWFGQTGPYWEDIRQHPNDEYYECKGEVVTDTAIGECCYLQLSNRPAQLVSITPSKWMESSLTVTLYKNDDESYSSSIFNHIDSVSLNKVLQNSEPVIQSWSELEQLCLSRFENLIFSTKAFDPLVGRPFVLSAAKSIVDLLRVLSEFKDAHTDVNGRSEVGNKLYRDYFSSGVPWFSDSSNKEKSDFKKEMTFPHPEREGETIFAPFHGKVQTPQIRVHISWPVSAGNPLYVLYVGPKITRY